MSRPSCGIPPAGRPRRQRGAILIVTLLFLVILTMLGVTAMNSTTMEERMAGNTRDAAIALQAAEAALRDARRDLNQIPVTGSFGRARTVRLDDFGNNSRSPGSCNTADGLTGLCAPANNPDGTPYSAMPPSLLPDLSRQHRWNDSWSVAYGTYTNSPMIGGAGVLAEAPRYTMELFCLRQHGSSIGMDPNAGEFCNFYRITARGVGRNPNTQVTLQEVVAVE